MLVDFNTLPEESRVWIYHANRSFTEYEIIEITSKKCTLNIIKEQKSSTKNGLHIHHIIPKHNKGTDNISNLIVPAGT